MTMSPASRRASPRSWVAITTLMPRVADGANDVLHRLGGGGIEARGRLIEKQHGRVAASARASASRCCSPPESRRAGRSARPSRPTSRAVRSCGRVPARGRRRCATRSGCCRRHCVSASPAAETRSRAASAGHFAAAPGHAPARWPHEAHRHAQQRGLPRAIRPDQQCRRTGASESDIRSRIVPPPARTCDVIEHDRQFDCGARMVIPPVVRRPAARSRQAR